MTDDERDIRTTTAYLYFAKALVVLCGLYATYLGAQELFSQYQRQRVVIHGAECRPTSKIYVTASWMYPRAVNLDCGEYGVTYTQDRESLFRIELWITDTYWREGLLIAVCDIKWSGEATNCVVRVKPGALADGGRSFF